MELWQEKVAIEQKELEDKLTKLLKFIDSREPWQERVVIEQKELEDKLTKLLKFIDSSNYEKLSEIDRCFLDTQAAIMALYNRVLLKRIERF